MRARSFALSLVLQILGVLLILAVPLLRPEALPKGLVNFISITAPPGRPVTPPPPPDPGPVARRAPPQLLSQGRLTLPPSIPPLQTFIDPEPLPSGGPVVPNSTGDSAMSPAIGSIVRSTNHPVVPPPPPPVDTAAAVKPTPERIIVGGKVQEALLVHKVTPVYPPLARINRVSGTVRFTAIVGRDGTIQGLTLLEGNPLLVPAATSAVRQWRYRPTYLNGDPIEVVTVIDVRFVLN